MTAVYVLRHPQTTWNATKRYQGRLEAPVSPEGEIQARLVTRAFDGQPIDAIYSSPLQRALYLARQLAHATDAPLYVDQRLTEVGQSVWEGLYVSEIKRLYPALYASWYSEPDMVEFPHGERLAAVRDRALAALDAVCRRFPDGNVAMVTHSVVVQTMVAAALCLELRHIHRIPVANASVTTLCGRTAPGSLLAVNVTEPLHHSPVASAAEYDCVSWKREGASR